MSGDELVTKEFAIKERRGEDLCLVFEGKFIPGTEMHEFSGLYAEPRVNGSFELQVRTDLEEFTNPNTGSLEINAYVPGNWEAHLESLVRLAKQREAEARRRQSSVVEAEAIRQAKERALEERKRFGL